MQPPKSKDNAPRLVFHVSFWLLVGGFLYVASYGPVLRLAQAQRLPPQLMTVWRPVDSLAMTEGPVGRLLSVYLSYWWCPPR
jgi:hypothetical protein